MESLLNSEKLRIEKEETFPKQTIRNRCAILTANGPLNLIVPILHSKVKNQKTSDIEIDCGQNWQSKHLQAIKSAYASAPYFEDYFWKIEDILSVKSPCKLIDLNTEITRMLSECIDEKITMIYTECFIKNTIGRDTNYLNKSYSVQRYHQVFNEKFGFVSNLSFLDLLMNEGPMARHFVLK